MEAVAHNPAFAKKVGIKQSVGKDFSAADKGKTFKKGGDTMASKMNSGFMKMIAEKKAMAKKPAEKMAKGGMSCSPKKMAKGGGIEVKGKTKGTMIKMAGSTGMKKGGKC